jgi:TRAP-type C4-dicarboxylate transport system substrate-binding protein
MLVRRSIALLALTLAGCGGAARVGGSSRDTHVLTLLNPIGDRQEAVAFTEEVARLSKGALRIRLVASPHQGRTDFEAAAIRDVRHGRTDLGLAGSRAWKGSLQALNAPLLIDSYALEERVLRDGLTQRMLEELRPLGLVGLGVMPGPMRRPVGVKKRLVAPRDFRGLAMGEQQSSVAAATLSVLGARPVALSVTRDEPGLAGLETSAGALEAGRYDAAGSHVSANVNLWPRPFVVFANDRAFAKLADDQRRILRAAVASAVPRLAAQQRSNEAEVAANICRRGRMTFDTAAPSELRALRAAVEPVYRDLSRSPATRAAIEKITALKREVSQPPATLPACESGAAPLAKSRTPLDGTWQMDTKRSASAPDYLDENWGQWTFVFDRGRFGITQENAKSCTWGYGTYTVDGDKTTWRFTDGGGEAPNGAENKPGEEFSYRVSRFRDTVTLGPVADAVSPTNFDAEPWRRIGAPAPDKLSRRCPPPDAALRR